MMLMYVVGEVGIGRSALVGLESLGSVPKSLLVVSTYSFKSLDDIGTSLAQ